MLRGKHLENVTSLLSPTAHMSSLDEEKHSTLFAIWRNL